MSFRARLEAIPETVQEFELAWELRYAEGQQLLVRRSDQNTTAAGIYLLGYVAEMILKVAYFRFYKPETGDNISSRLFPTRARAEDQKIGIKDEHFHSLIFWLAMLLHERKIAGRPMRTKEIENNLRRRVERLYQNCYVGIRYRAVPATVQEGLDVLEDVTWLVKNHVSLWR